MCTVVQAGTMSMSLQQQDESVDEPPLFATTSSFTTIHGFVVPLVGPPGPGALVAAAPAEADPQAAGAASAQRASSLRVRIPSCSEKCGAAVGWTGLLESSRATGSCGVMGSTDGSSSSDGGPVGHIEVCCTTHTTPGVRRLVKAVVRGLKACQEPERAVEGMGGTYFLPNEAGRKVAILKPCDEEPLAPHNPKGYVGRALGDPGWKPTVRVGEAAMREVAAYLLDHDHFAKVPHTVLVRAQHPILHYNLPAAAAAGSNSSASSSTLGEAESMDTSSGGGGAPSTTSSLSGGGAAAPGAMKLGSLQEFVYHIADTSEMGTQRLSKRDVHHIGILDVRLFNTDRHAGNMLVRLPGGGSASSAALAPGGRGGGLGRLAEGTYEVIPIDHGFCLPEALEAPYFEWLHWPQALLPFDGEDLEYIAALDVQADIDLLRRELPALRPECLRVLEVSTLLLQRCAAAGLTLTDIGGLMSRPLDALEDEGSPSELEKACVAARQAMETRQLAAQMSGSSCSSASILALREEDEDTLLEEDEEGECEGDSEELLEEGEGVPISEPISAEGPAAGRLPEEVETPGLMLLARSLGQVALEGGEGGSRGSMGSGDTAFAAAAAAGPVAAELDSTSGGSRPGVAGTTGVEPDLLFDLDEEGSGSGSLSGGRRGSCELAPLSPYGSGMSLESHGSGQLGGDLRLTTPTSRLGGGAGGSSMGLGGWGAPAAGPMASSLYSTGGLLWRGRQGQRVGYKAGGVGGGPGGKKRSGMGAGGGRRLTGVYPPPVIAAPPRAVNEVLCAMSGEAWEAFMEELGRVMEDLLVSGAWCRQVPSSGGAAMSCPRF